MHLPRGLRVGFRDSNRSALCGRVLSPAKRLDNRCVLVQASSTASLRRCQGIGEALCRRVTSALHSRRIARIMANIYDVANHARVSVATVSAVLNDSAFVSDGLKSRVQTAVSILGYEPNLLARGLAKQRTQ